MMNSDRHLRPAAAGHGVLVAAAVALVLLAFAIWRGLSGWWLRGLASLALLVAVSPTPRCRSRTASR